MFGKKYIMTGCALSLWLAAGLGLGVQVWPSVPEEIVDRIVALANDEVITLSDVHIVSAFGLVSDAVPSVRDGGFDRVLDELINQKIVLHLTGDASPIQENVVEEFRDGIIAKMGAARFREELEGFGMTSQDLVPYLKERIAYQNIIAEKFKTSTAVSLDEIENYYEQQYLKDRREKGEEAKPMVNVLGQIEEAIKQEKSKQRIEEWINNLRQRSDIQKFQ